MRARRAVIVLVTALVALLATGCVRTGGEEGGAGAGPDRQATRAAPAPAREAQAGAGIQGGEGGGQKAGGIRLADLSNRIVRTATLRLEVGKGELEETVRRATEVVQRHQGTYAAASTEVPEDGTARGRVTFKVPVREFEAALADLKRLGTYKGESASSEDVTGEYVDLRGQLNAWRAQERAYLRLLDRATSISDIISVQNQLQQVQASIERLQGQLDYLEERSDYSTIVLELSEPGAAPARRDGGVLAAAWSTALEGLQVMAAVALVLAIWAVPLGLVAALVVLGLRWVRRARPAAAGPGGQGPGIG